jgi:hypothetical protein
MRSASTRTATRDEQTRQHARTDERSTPTH